MNTVSVVFVSLLYVSLYALQYNEHDRRSQQNLHCLAGRV